IEGLDPRRIEFIVQKLRQQARFPPWALGLAAISTIDHGLWDISAKALGVPVYMLLGGNARDRVRVYCGVYTAPDPKDCLELTQSLNEKWGFTAFKLSPYRTDLHSIRWGEVVRQSAEYFARLREIAPGEFEFAFDAHAKIFEPYQAIQLGNALAPYDPLFFEEPIRPEHIPAWGRLRAELKCPLATGESLYNRFEFLSLLTAGGADIVQPDICVVGGLLEMRRIATLAEAHFVTVAPHNPMGPLATAVNLHFSAAQPNFKILEYRLPEGAPWVKDPYLPKDGHLELRPDRPGWGVEIDEEMLKRDDYVHWERKLPIRPDGSTGYT
ncbi:MAG TPA: mandelate racemase/muconate lactonizing enzyme family protein, partial [Geminicoccaceae bacterium]|nr:mandelate racemase/muconate lactonizing enzyme family protein [Geminicoccaceae bacterium]